MLDFRSDTITKPTEAMRKAIATAEVGDAGRGDDPTVLALEARMVELTGKEASVYLPSGTMGNLTCLMAHLSPGDELILEETAHIYNSELGGFAAVASALPRIVASDNEGPLPDAIAEAIRERGSAGAAPTGVICLENSRNAAGGRVIGASRMAQVQKVAQANGVPVHLDGARLFNAAAYLDVPVAELCGYVDSAMIALSKGLGAPVGSVAVGDAAFVKQVRKKTKMLGGVMRQAGLLAAAALVALEDPYEQLRVDHEMARRLAIGLSDIGESLVDMEGIQTNIVNCYLHAYGGTAPQIHEAFNAAGVRVMMSRDQSRLRFVTHRHIDIGSIDECLAIAKRVFASFDPVARISA